MNAAAGMTKAKRSAQNHKTTYCVRRDSFEIDISKECMEAAKRRGVFTTTGGNHVLGNGCEGVNHFSTVFMGVDNGVDNGSPPRLLHGNGFLRVDNWVDNKVS